MNSNWYSDGWAVCRAMANRKRLEILRLLIPKGELNVSDVARRVILAQPTASQYLDRLKRVGIVATRRENASVCYRAEAREGSLAAQECIKFLNTYLREENLDSILELATAFSHPRRIILFNALVELGASDVKTLADNATIPELTCFRQLQALVNLGIVAKTLDEGVVYSVRTPYRHLLKEFMPVISQGR